MKVINFYAFLKVSPHWTRKPQVGGGEDWAPPGMKRLPSFVHRATTVKPQTLGHVSILLFTVGFDTQYSYWMEADVLDRNSSAALCQRSPAAGWRWWPWIQNSAQMAFELCVTLCLHLATAKIRRYGEKMLPGVSQKHWTSPSKLIKESDLEEAF